MKRIFAAVMAIALAFCLCPTAAFANYTGEITSSCAVMVDADTGTVLYSKNGSQRAYPASTTKLMTALVVTDYVSNLEEYVTVGPEVWRFSENNILVGIVEHEKVRVIDLLYGMLLPSGNDAAAALACYVGGSIDGFAELMNLKAKELGMDNSHFVNPHGLNNDEHYTTAEDMAKLAVAVSKNEAIMEIVGTATYTMPETNRSQSRTLTTTNKFLKGELYWDAVTGMKTGQTSAAKNCLVTSAQQDGKSLIVVILGDASDGGTARWSETRALLEYGFAHYTAMPLSVLALEAPVASVTGCSRNDSEGGSLTLSYDYGNAKLAGFAEDLDYIKLHKDEIQISYNYLSDPLKAPIEAGAVVGTAALTFEGETIAVIDLIASRDVLADGDSALVSSAGQLTPAPRASDSDSKGGGLPIVPILIGIAVLVALVFIGRKLFPSRRRRHTSKRALKKSYYVYKGK